MIVTPYSGNSRIFASGTFILRDKDDFAKINIDLRPELNFKMDVIFKFINRDDAAEPRVEMRSETGKVIEFTIINGETLLGNSSPIPVLIGDFDVRKKKKLVYLNYFFQRVVKDSPIVFTYSIYMEG